jgi:hypothetical protein
MEAVKQLVEQIKDRFGVMSRPVGEEVDAVERALREELKNECWVNPSVDCFERNLQLDTIYVVWTFGAHL